MEDLTGKVFGKWHVLKRVENNSRGASMWECKCECGKISIIPGSNLRTGRTSKCYSCSAKERMNERSHGMWGTKIYKVWKNMRQRCQYPKNKDYENYGGRGIKVCEEWDKNFLSFYESVSKLENYGKEGYTLDRIDVNKNYEPGNVRWATRYEQIHNRRISKKIISKMQRTEKRKRGKTYDKSGIDEEI